MIRRKENKIIGICFRNELKWHSFDKNNPEVPDQIKKKVLNSIKNLEKEEQPSPPKNKLEIMDQSIDLDFSLSIEDDPHEFDFLYFTDLNQEDTLQFESLIL